METRAACVGRVSQGFGDGGVEVGVVVLAAETMTFERRCRSQSKSERCYSKSCAIVRSGSGQERRYCNGTRSQLLHSDKRNWEMS